MALSVKKVTLWRTEVENKPGVLSSVLAPLADVGAGAARVISVGYLALAPSAVDTHAPDTAWSPWSRFFPWENWRNGRPELIDSQIRPQTTGAL